MKETLDLVKKANQIRKDLLQMIYKAKAGHTGGSLSSVDILVALYYAVMDIDPSNPDWEDRDHFIMSKGHSVEGLYCVLADKGFFPKERLETFSQYESDLIGHPSLHVPGIEANTGALGHGLSIGVGTAIALKMDKKPQRVFVLMGDGELAEGSIWEAAMAGANYKLDNLIGIIDRNGLQISGNTEDVMALGDLRAKWEAFGWQVTTVNGHDFSQLITALTTVTSEKPHLILAKTVKGKGVSFMENVAKWHHGVPSEEQMQQALSDLEQG